jgi:nicotinamidase-related amidase
MKRVMPTRLHSGRCLLLVDVFSHFRFEDGEPLALAQSAAATSTDAAAAACRRHGIPVIYCNDNFGRWHETWEQLFAFTAREGLPASAELLSRLHPQPADIVLLKSRHSAFFHTQLVPLLEDLRVKEIAIGGAATDACVLCSAIDAHVRGFKVTILHDAVAAATDDRHRRALDHMRESLGLRVCPHRDWLGEGSAQA